MEKKSSRPVLEIIRQIMVLAKPHRRLFIFGLTLGLLDSVAQATIPLFFRYVINGLEKNPAVFFAERMTAVIFWGLLLAAIYLPTVHFFHTLISIASIRILMTFRITLYRHVQKLSADFFARTNVGEITNRLNNDLTSGVNGFLAVLRGVAPHLAITIFAMIMMFRINLKLSLFFIFFAIIVGVFSRFYLPRVRSKSREVADAGGNVSAAITEYIGGNILVKAFSLESSVCQRVADKCDFQQQKGERLIWYQYRFTDLSQLMTVFIVPLGLLFYGGALIARQRLLIGDLVVFWVYWLMIGNVVTYFTTVSTTFVAALASLDRVFDFMDETPFVKDRPGAKRIEGARGHITFENVYFKYPVGSNQVVLDNVSFEIAAGRKVALVGASGAGKSTILQLLLRFYDPIEGTVRLDGHDLRNLKQQSLRQQIGIVMQESIFFNGTIRENMRYIKPEATDEEVRKALAKADAFSFVEAMPDGINTVIGERGARLSGGQRQRLAIARIFLKDPPIIVLDEATSALDSISETQVQKSFQKLLEGRTVLVIAHHMNTIRDADEIFIIQDGKIYDRGSHEDLLDRCQIYTAMCKHYGD